MREGLIAFARGNNRSSSRKVACPCVVGFRGIIGIKTTERRV